MTSPSDSSLSDNPTSRSGFSGTLSMLGREIRPQLDHNAALGGVDDDRVLLIQIGGQRLLRERGHCKQERDNEGKSADHGNSGVR